MKKLEFETLDANSQRKARKKGGSPKRPAPNGKPEKEEKKKTPKPLIWLAGIILCVINPVLLGSLIVVSFKRGSVASTILFLVFAFLYTWLTYIQVQRYRGMLPEPTEEPKKKRKFRVSSRMAVILLAVLPLLPIPWVSKLYNDMFNHHVDTVEGFRRTPEEFPGLKMERVSFPSDAGQKLAGYVMTRENTGKKAVIVFAHGLGGGGFNSYMDVADWFAKRGYVVFGYDATGNDASEGDRIPGLRQGVIDLDYAIRYVKTRDDLKDLPLILAGHSWGANAACCELKLRPEVSAVASFSGFNSVEDIINAQAKHAFGPSRYWFMPYYYLYSDLLSAKGPNLTAIEGFEASKAAVAIVQGGKDATVPAAYGYDIFLEKYKDDPRFTFLLEPEKDHNAIFYSDAAIEYRKRANEEFIKYCEDKGLKRTVETLTGFMKDHVDKALYYQLDEALLEKVVSVFDKAVGK